MNYSKDMSEAKLLLAGYKKYVGRDIDVFYNRELCKHVGNCVRGDRDVFKVGRRPWIIPDNGSAKAIGSVVDTCPSGALKFIIKGE